MTMSAHTQAKPAAVPVGRELSCRSDEFSLPDSGHYLNCAYMSPLPKRVELAGMAGMQRKRAPAGIRAQDFFEDAQKVRERYARLIGSGEPGRVAIIPGVSYGIAIAARNASCAAGQTIVVSGEQFPSNVLAWQRLARSSGATLRTIEPPVAADRGHAWNEAIFDAIDASTAVVALPAVHWTDGTRFDLEAIGRRARDTGAAFVIDATQSVGALPFDVEAIGADAVVCAAYKWLLGPYGIGVAWLGPRYDGGEPLEETWIGRAGSEDFRGLVRYRDEYQPGNARFDMGGRSNFILLPMLVAALDLVLELEPSRIQDYCRALTAPALEELRALGYGIEPEARRSNHLFGIRMPANLDLAALQATLERRGISASLRGSALRISPHVYNDTADMAALTSVLRDAATGHTPASLRENPAHSS